MQEDKLILGGCSFSSRFILGSGKYSLPLIKAAAEQAGAQIITLALRRAQSQQDNILDFIPSGITLLPNTSGARTAEEAIRIARLPYMYPDLNTARDLRDAGAASIMPLGAPIGSNKGLATRDFIKIIIDEIALPVIVDAGIGRPSQACEAMEMGAAAVMANTAIATAGDIPLMAAAFKQAVEAGRAAYLAGLGRVLEQGAAASSPLTGFLEDR